MSALSSRSVTRSFLVKAALLVVLAWATGVARAGDPPADPDVTGTVPLPKKGVPTIELTTETEIEASGDGKMVLEVRYPPAIHHKLRRLLTQRGIIPPPDDAYPAIEAVARYLNLDPGDVLLKDIKGKYGAETIRIEGSLAGLARVKGGVWIVPLSHTRPFALISKERSQVVTLHQSTMVGGLQAIHTWVLRLPKGAYKIEVVEKPNQLRFRLPPRKAGAATTGRATLSLKMKPYLLGAMYKAYSEPRFGHLWVARSVFHNGTGETLTDYRVRFRLAGYSEWSAWSKSEVVLAGQTVVDPFRPIIDPGKVQALTSAAPLDVLYEYEYTRADGKVVKDSDSERTKILPTNEGVYSDLPLTDRSVWVEVFKDAPVVLAMFVSAKDPVIRDTAALVSRSIGGRGASLSDENAIKFAEGLYTLMRANISYETTAGALLDGRLHQDLKYGRDVLRTKAGTCVNTSILFASVAEAAGLKSVLVLVPGHAYAGIRLPKSGKLFFVETTGCGDGKMGPRGLTFAQATDLAAREFERDQKRGLMVLVDIGLLRELGMMPPELARVPDDSLRSWGIKMPAVAETRPVAKKGPAATATIVKKAALTRNGERCGSFTVRVKINGMKGQVVKVVGLFRDAEGNLVRSRRAGYSAGGYLIPRAEVTPTSDEYEEDVVLYFPLTLLPGGRGEHTFTFYVGVLADGGNVLESMPSRKFTITRR
jgi:hypothetical protein